MLVPAETRREGWVPWSLELELQRVVCHLTWVLGVELESLRRAASLQSCRHHLDTHRLPHYLANKCGYAEQSGWQERASIQMQCKDLQSTGQRRGGDGGEGGKKGEIGKDKDKEEQERERGRGRRGGRGEMGRGRRGRGRGREREFQILPVES